MNCNAGEEGWITEDRPALAIVILVCPGMGHVLVSDSHGPLWAVRAGSFVSSLK